MGGTSRRRVWFDLLTPKQVLFFGPMIKYLEGAGFDVLATSRKYREVGPLADRSGLRLQYVGERGTKGPEQQLLAATRRQSELIPIIMDFDPRAAVSIASSVCARVAYGLGIKHISVNDSPHSEVAGRLSLPLTFHLFCPWVIPFAAWKRYGLARSQVSTYHALDPAVWLKRPPTPGPVPDLEKSKRTITVRVQESDAPYLAGADLTWTDTILEALSDEFPDVNLVALCRYDFQVEEVRAKFGHRVVVPDEVVGGYDLLASTDLFIGMGGTMTAEAALMGIPAITAFQGELYTDRYLESVGLLARALKKNTLISKAKVFLTESHKKKIVEKSKKLLDAMEDPVPKVSDFIAKTAEQG
jgi:uncharacterized protein